MYSEVIAPLVTLAAPVTRFPDAISKTPETGAGIEQLLSLLREKVQMLTENISWQQTRYRG